MPSSRNYRLVKALRDKLGLEGLAALEVEAVKTRSVPPRLLDRLTNEHNLSPRQREIMVLVVSGFTRQEIADELGIGSETVKRHLQQAYLKLGVHNKIEAINAFIEDEA